MSAFPFNVSQQPDFSCDLSDEDGQPEPRRQEDLSSAFNDDNFARIPSTSAVKCEPPEPLDHFECPPNPEHLFPPVISIEDEQPRRLYMKYTDKMPCSFGHIPSYTSFKDIPQLLSENAQCSQMDPLPASNPRQVFPISRGQRKPVFRVQKMGHDVSTMLEQLGTTGFAGPAFNEVAEAMAARIMEALKPDTENAGRRVGCLTSGERGEKIRRYRDKRAKRQWNKRIEYNVRRKVAEKRNRIQGRFAGKKLARSLIDSTSNCLNASEGKPDVIATNKPNQSIKTQFVQTQTLPILAKPIFRSPRCFFWYCACYTAEGSICEDCCP